MISNVLLVTISSRPVVVRIMQFQQTKTLAYAAPKTPPSS